MQQMPGSHVKQSNHKLTIENRQVRAASVMDQHDHSLDKSTRNYGLQMKQGQGLPRASSDYHPDSLMHQSLPSTGPLKKAGSKLAGKKF
jgi:hypothetical protein